MKKFLKPAQVSFAQDIIALTCANPFSAERRQLANSLLGSSASTHGSYSARAQEISSLAQKQIEGIRQQLIQKDASLCPAEEELYSWVSYFVVYHQLSQNIDDIIAKAHQQGKCPAITSLYQKHCQQLDHYFKSTTQPISSLLSYQHLFAVFFQIRRAFYHIDRFIIGQSAPATALRCQIWNSIFTHDMRRYQTHLYDKMGDLVTLILGPSGSGKELAARAIGLSRFVPFDPIKKKFQEDFVTIFHPINLSALSSNLIESELFGHQKGAFTGALQDRKGYLEQCGQWGTIFLDEIGEADAAIQVKLLRVLQTREFQRLGDTTLQRFGGKFMAATNRNLIDEIAQGHFREDLYYRLCADQIQTPALHAIVENNPDELQALIQHILQRFLHQDCPQLSHNIFQEIKNKLGLHYPWPGNFRELEQTCKSILVQGHCTPRKRPTQQDPFSLDHLLQQNTSPDQVLAHYLQLAYQTDNNYEKISQRLGVDRRTVKKYVHMPTDI